MMPGTTGTVLLGLLGIAIAAQSQTSRKTHPEPAPLELSLNAAGELTVTAPFSLKLSAYSFPAEISIKAEAGILRVVCTWEPNTTLQVALNAAAGHGLPGHIGLASQIGQSPVTIEAQLPPEQVKRGPVYIEISNSPFLRGGAGVVHGTIVASIAVTSGVAEIDDQERTQTALEEGRLLSAAEVSALENKLKTNPHDWSARLSLLAYYSSSAGLRISKAQIVEARRRHILWVIENRPVAAGIFDLHDLQIDAKGPLADPKGMKEAELSWQRVIADQGGESQVFLNAASFSAETDPAFSERTLLQAKSRSANDENWDLMLGWLYAMATVPGADAVFAEHARVALAASGDVAVLAGAASQLQWLQLASSITPQNPHRSSHPAYSKLAGQLASRAEQLAAHAVSLAPENPYLLLPLLQALTVEVEAAETTEQQLIAEKKVYGLFQHFDDIAVDPADRIVLLPVLASLALDVKDDKAATTYAKQALDLAPHQGEKSGHGTANDPPAIHDANDVLGRVALHDGNLQLAKEYLLKASAIPLGEDTSNFEPRMELAQALLDRGERDVVLKYLENLKTSWRHGGLMLDLWIAAIQRGKPVRLNTVDTPMRAPSHR